MDKTRDSTNSKIWPDSTCAISVKRKGQILLVVESLVLSTTVFVNLLDLHPKYIRKSIYDLLPLFNVGLWTFASGIKSVFN